MRQTDFVWLDGERITDFVYPMEALPEMTREISERFGFPLELRRRSNSTEARLTGAMGTMQKGLARLSRTMLPRDLHERMRQRTRGFERRRAASKTSPVFDSKRVHEFVADFYAPDAELHAKAQEWIAEGAPRRSD